MEFELSQKIETIGQDELDNLGVDRETGELYWDGKKIVTTSKVRLGKIELWFAGIATVSTAGMFALALGDAFCWW